ncbi:alpha-amylase [Aspergillus sp. HF37]|nr:alpha-amylase [Aspergillus sp. HF37]
MFQAFEWHVPADHAHWRRLRRALPDLKDIGVDNVWIPPGCKAMGPDGNGYDIYDMYDLGEFDQKGSRATKWGPKEDLLELTWAAQDLGIGVYWDTVLNHKAAADYPERFLAVQVDPRRRDVEISHPEQIEGWVGFDFPGRGDTYSSMKYHWWHFNGVDWDESRKKNAIFKTVGPNKDWAADVTHENGNYDYLMFANLDYSCPDVQRDVLQWGEWIGTELPLSGMRIDGAKHFSFIFQRRFIDQLHRVFGPDYFVVGEFWNRDVQPILDYLQEMQYRLAMIDSPLTIRFSNFSQSEGSDLRKIFDDTLVKHKPAHAVTFVMNHDSQPGQMLDHPIAPFFKPLAYALIFLRAQGHPCLFYGDLYGINGGSKHPPRPSCNGRLPILARARKLYAYGEQRDYFDKRNCIGFVRYGNRRHPSGLACVLSNAKASRKRMHVGRNHAGELWTDILGWCADTIAIDQRGYGIFPVGTKSVSVWVNAAAEGRQHLASYFNTDIYGY